MIIINFHCPKRKKLILCLGIVACLLFCVAGFKLQSSGDGMKELFSVSGTSVAEAYYRDMGDFSKGMGIFCFGLGIVSLIISIGISANIKEEISDEASEKLKEDIENLELEIANKKEEKSKEITVHKYADEDTNHEYITEGDKNE
jgi:hypothetical protein